MTKQELIKIIDEKILNAERDLIIMTSNDKKYNQCLCIELKGEIQAYTEILELLESSELLNGNISVDLDALNILMRYREIHIYNKNNSFEMELWGDLINKITKEEYEKLKWYIALHKKLDL